MSHRAVDTGKTAGYLRELAKWAKIEHEARRHVDTLMMRAWDAGATDVMLAEVLDVAPNAVTSRRARIRKRLALRNLPDTHRIGFRRRPPVA